MSRSIRWFRFDAIFYVANEMWHMTPEKPQLVFISCSTIVQCISCQRDKQKMNKRKQANKQTMMRFSRLPYVNLTDWAKVSRAEISIQMVCNLLVWWMWHTRPMPTFKISNSHCKIIYFRLRNTNTWNMRHGTWDMGDGTWMADRKRNIEKKKK